MVNDRTLVVIDSYEMISSLDGWLREVVIPELRDSTLVVFGSRQRPSPGWFEGGWDAVFESMALEGLSTGDLRATRPGERRTAAGGRPAGEAGPRVTAGGDGRSARRPARIGRRSRRPPARPRGRLRSLPDAERRRHRPGDDAGAARSGAARDRWARGLQVAGRPVVQRTARRRHRAAHPRRRRRAGGAARTRSHGRRCSCGGGSPTTCTSGRSPDSSRCRRTCSTSSSTPTCGGGSLPTSAAATASTNCDRVTSRSSGRSCTRSVSTSGGRSPRRSSVGIRTSSGSPATATVASVGTTWRSPRPTRRRRPRPTSCWARGCGTCARRCGHDSAVLWREAVDLTGEHGQVTALLGTAGILGVGVVNPRYGLLPIAPEVPMARAFGEALGAVHVPELDVHAHGMELECHVVDFGPRGLLGFQRDWIYRETGAVPPAESGRRRPRAPDPPAPRSERAHPRPGVARRTRRRSGSRTCARRCARRSPCSATAATTCSPGRSSKRRTSATAHRTRRSPGGSTSAGRPTSAACRPRPAASGPSSHAQRATPLLTARTPDRWRT